MADVEKLAHEAIDAVPKHNRDVALEPIITTIESIDSDWGVMKRMMLTMYR